MRTKRSQAPAGAGTAARHTPRTANEVLGGALCCPSPDADPCGSRVRAVGADIPPGRYRASAPTEECEWERRDAGGVTGFGDSSMPVAEVALDLGSLDRTRSSPAAAAGRGRTTPRRGPSSPWT